MGLSRSVVMKKIAILVLLLVAAGSAIAWYRPGEHNPEQLNLHGTVEVQEVHLGSKIGGRVAAVLVKEGQIVEPGQVVATFETPELSARLDQARARLESAKANLDK